MRALVLRSALLLVLTGCAGHQQAIEDARQAVGRIVYYAQATEEVAAAVCTLDPKGTPCELLVKALDELYAKAVAAEAALNRGEEIDHDKLEADIRALYEAARDIYRSAV